MNRYRYCLVVLPITLAFAFLLGGCPDEKKADAVDGSPAVTATASGTAAATVATPTTTAAAAATPTSDAGVAAADAGGSADAGKAAEAGKPAKK